MTIDVATSGGGRRNRIGSRQVVDLSGNDLNLASLAAIAILPRRAVCQCGFVWLQGARSAALSFGWILLSRAPEKTSPQDSARKRLTPSQHLYLWTRDLHLYLGLFISPFVLLYALSAITLNHAVLPWGGRDGPPAGQRRADVGPQTEEDGIALAKSLRRQLDLQGEIGFVNRNEAEQTLAFPIERPGKVTKVEVDLRSGAAVIEERETGLWDAMIYLHKKPGPHNVKLRGNSAPMRAWAWLADTSVYALLLSSLTGIYLWTVLRAERKAGLLFLGGGVATFSLALVALMGLLA